MLVVAVALFPLSNLWDWLFLGFKMSAAGSDKTLIVFSGFSKSDVEQGKPYFPLYHQTAQPKAPTTPVSDIG
jgi:hypothetical protein